MAELKIKLKFGSFEFEIEGDKESIIEEFKSIRENGISKVFYLKTFVPYIVP